MEDNKRVTQSESYVPINVSLSDLIQRGYVPSGGVNAENVRLPNIGTQPTIVPAGTSTTVSSTNQKD